MDLRAVLTDLDGRALAFLGDETFSITAKVEEPLEVQVDLGRGSGLASVLDVGRIAVQIFDGATLRFFGKVWEPLSIGSGGIQIRALGPLAEFVERYVQDKKDYTATNNGGGPWDAGQILFDRLAIQNARRNTYLRAGTRQASANRVRTALPGALEEDVLKELTGAGDGFFYREVPVLGVAGVMADLNITFPNAGSERLEITFGWGDDTEDNCTEYEQVTRLPVNFYTAAASAATGGRIAKAASKASSITTYGLFESQVTWSDVTDVTLLQQQADASAKADPPVTMTLTPGPDAPLLFKDFNVGDFVRVHIADGDLKILDWARVIEATLSKNAAGNVVLSSVTLEIVEGGTVTVSPSALWRAQLDEQRRRLEALERRQQNVTETAVAAPAPPAAGDPGSGSSTAPPPVESAPPAPPPAPPAPPTITSLSATGVNFRQNGVLHRGVEVSISVDLKGLSGVVTINAGGGSADLHGSGSVFIATAPGSHSVGASARTSAGTASATTSATVPSITQE